MYYCSMNLQIVSAIGALWMFMACNDNAQNQSENNTMNRQDTVAEHASHYTQVNGIRMYYEIYGKGKPLVLLHGGGSTIHTTFGRIIPALAENRQLIAVELQGHGHSSDRDAGFTFEQDADDVAALLKELKIGKVDVFGFSNGGTTALQLAIRHPDMVNRVIAASALFKRSGASPQFWEFMNQARIEHMPAQYKDEYRKVAPDPERLQVMHDKCAKRMAEFTDISDELISSVKAPVLLMNGDADVASTEHMAAMCKLIPHCQLAIFPGGHGKYIGEITTLTGDAAFRPYVVPVIEEFLDAAPAK